MRSPLHRFFPFLAWPRPSRETLRNELWAGLTVGLMLVPQAVAYAQVAGMPLVTGIYASLLPALVAVLWSSSTRLGVGPTALTSPGRVVYPDAGIRKHDVFAYYRTMLPWLLPEIAGRPLSVVRCPQGAGRR